jgi:hypothetical protein
MVDRPPPFIDSLLRPGPITAKIIKEECEFLRLETATQASLASLVLT